MQTRVEVVFRTDQGPHLDLYVAGSYHQEDPSKTPKRHRLNEAEAESVVKALQWGIAFLRQARPGEKQAEGKATPAALEEPFHEADFHDRTGCGVSLSGFSSALQVAVGGDGSEQSVWLDWAEVETMAHTLASMVLAQRQRGGE